MRRCTLALLFSAAAAQFAVAGPPGRYVVICPDAFVEAVQPLAEWKTLKGLRAAVVPLSEAGYTPEDVRDFLRDAWQNWPEPPGQVLIACSGDSLPGYDYENDSYYGDMAGDYRMEIPVGRLPCRSVAECSLMVAKTLAWDRYPEETDTLWYRKGTTIVSQEDTVNIDTLYGPDSRLARQYWLDAGYVLAESLSNMTGHSTVDAVAALHDGRTFITYRGAASGFWSGSFYDFWPHDWHNGRRMPIVVSATCATVTVAPDEQMLGDMCLAYGSPDSLGGMVAFFGTTLLGSRISIYRSAAYRGFFDAVFREDRHRLGDATLRARFRVDSLYGVEEYYWEWALLGDPDLSVWTGVPRTALVVHDSVLGLGPQQFEVLVTTAGQPVSGALVCLAMGTTVYCRDTTDASGRVVLEPAAIRPGAAAITVTGPNLRPHEGQVAVRSLGDAFVAYLRHEVNDSPPAGNGDRNLNPGETVKLPVWVVNYGDSTAREVEGVLRTADTMATVLDSVRGFGDIAGFDTSWTGEDGFGLRASQSCPDGHRLNFVLVCRDSAARFWESRFVVMVGSPVLEFGSYEVLDSAGNNNGRLDPREAADLVIRLDNAGSGMALGLSAKLRSADPRLTVLDSSGYYDSVPGSGSARNLGDRFRVAAGFMLPGTELPCSLYLSAIGFADTLGFVFRVGEIGERDPIPDIPGNRYWAYDDVDTAYIEHPAYDWVELRGVGTRVQLGDNQTATVPLPAGFGPFRYYDESYDSVSICSNGWLAPGAVTGTWWENRILPNPSFPRLLAVNWDDLLGPFSGGIWHLWDSAGHRFIVEWDSIHYRMPLDSFDTFQAIIYDTTRAAQDGTNEFVFQYRTANCLNRSTIGIQDPTRQIAINVVYDNQWNRAAAPVVPGRAIKFTTDPPVVGIRERAGRMVLGRRQSMPTIVRGMLRIASSIQYPAFRGELLDATGRRVKELAPGPNDVSHLRAGVYFVREYSVSSSQHSASSSEHSSAVRKVLLVR